MAKWQNKFSDTTKTLVFLLLQIHAHPPEGSKKILIQYFLSPLRLQRNKSATEEEKLTALPCQNSKQFSKNNVL
jgi:hypothetical protein